MKGRVLQINTIKKVLSENVIKTSSVVPTLLLVYGLMILVFTLINPAFLSIGNLRGVFSNMAVLGILAIGITPVVLTRNFDLSIGATFGFTIVVVAVLLQYNLPVFLVIVIALSIGAIIGAINALIVTKVGVNSIIGTLAFGAMLRGVIYFISTDQIAIRSQSFLNLGRYFIGGFLPITFIYFLFIIVAVYLFMRFTSHGRNMYFVGSNEDAAKIAGINVSNTKFLPFVISGIAGAVAGIIRAAASGFSYPNYGVGYEFTVLAIVILGGISLVGGKGTLVGVFVAVLIVGSISNGLALIDVPVDWREAFLGIILIASILLDSIKNIRARKSKLLA